jgi:hypothetical protein
MNTIDFYTGFEGESMWIISQKDTNGQIQTEINVWAGYFDKMMTLIPPNSAGYWESVSLHYHLVEDIFMIQGNDIELYINQLSCIDAHLLCAKSEQLRLLLISICENALACDGFLIFEED